MFLLSPCKDVLSLLLLQFYRFREFIASFIVNFIYKLSLPQRISCWINRIKRTYFKIKVCTVVYFFIWARTHVCMALVLNNICLYNMNVCYIRIYIYIYIEREREKESK